MKAQCRVVIIYSNICTGVGSSCTDNSDCVAVANAVCRHKICTCPDNFVVSTSNNKCIPRKCLFSKFVFGTFYDESNIRNFILTVVLLSCP
jgi:hypothetical protein